ncbi:unnamed protein product, partial [Scytosiphon promiscuus]
VGISLLNSTHGIYDFELDDGPASSAGATQEDEFGFILGSPVVLNARNTPDAIHATPKPATPPLRLFRNLRTTRTYSWRTYASRVLLMTLRS